MTGEILLVLSILLGAIILFASEKIRIDLVALMVMVTLILSGLISAEEAFSGFASPAVVTVWAIYIVSASMTHTGIADFLGQYIGRIAGRGEARLILIIMVTVGGMSAFMNNIGATAILLPVVVTLGRRANVPASKLLIPLAFGSLLGGVTTLIGTPPNLLASNALTAAGYEPFSLFDYTPMGLIILLASILYMVLIGRHLLPSYDTANAPTASTDLTANYALGDYLSEWHIPAGSPLIGQDLLSAGLGQRFNVTVIGLIRAEATLIDLPPGLLLQEGDIMLVEGAPDDVMEAVEHQSIDVAAAGLVDADLKSRDATVAEIVVSQLANIIGQSLKDLDFRNRYGLTVLGIWRDHSPIVDRLADVKLQFGDTLLVHGRRDRIEAVRHDRTFLLLRAPDAPSPRLNKAPLNLLIFISMISMVALGWLHISVAAVLGAVLSVLTGCLTMDEAYAAVEWKSVFLIAGMLPMGIAMEKTGTATFLSDQIVGVVGPLGPQAIMVGLFVLTTILTAFMSNAAAAVLVAPIAISAALDVGADPRAFVMGVGIAASNSFVTPIGHQSTVLVYAPGGYRFFDYTKVGVPLTLLIWLLMIIFLPVFWPV